MADRDHDGETSGGESGGMRECVLAMSLFEGKRSTSNAQRPTLNSEDN
jgi:hypothetical protein